LEVLRLENTHISDKGLANLEGLASLKTLFLGSTQVTDKGLPHIGNLTGLERLCAHHTQITDAGLAHLKDWTGLKYLCLHDTRVADASLAHLQGLTSLETLYLHNTKVSDAGLIHLKSLTSLRQLNLSGTKVSSTGIMELKQALPNCSISRPRPSTVVPAKSQETIQPPPGVSAPSTGQLIGESAPVFTLQDLNGKQVSLSDFKGKVVVLDFWATWCDPCARAIPHMEALHKKYKEQGLVVIGINHERDHAKVKNFAKERISYIVLLDADEQFTEYGITGIPTAFYIDKEGKIRYRDVGFGPGKEKQMEQKIKELISK
jgi:thiol-disulfide isomerase/thioredoxin